jgi:hypothetical protein
MKWITQHYGSGETLTACKGYIQAGWNYDATAPKGDTCPPYVVYIMGNRSNRRFQDSAAAKEYIILQLKALAKLLNEELDEYGKGKD